MSLESAKQVFWYIHLPMMILFCIGMWIVVSGWFKGRVGEGAGGLTRRKLGHVLREVLSTIFSRRLWLLIKGFLVDAWFNRRLYRTHRLRWLTHFMLLSGFMLTMTLSGISALSEKVLIHIFHLEHIDWIAMWVNQDHPVTAVLNETGSLLMTAGLLFFIFRRYVIRLPQLRTSAVDTWMVFGFGLILLSGWATELIRLNSNYAGATAYYAFIGYPLAPLLIGLNLDWGGLYPLMYVIHGIITSIVIVTIPFSKFMHVIAGALVTIIRRVQEEGRNASA